MLTADLVRARKKGGELLLSKITPKQRERALELAEQYIGLFLHAEGERERDLREAIEAIPVGARERKLSLGLIKLLFDRAEFDGPSDLDPATLRREIFEAAATARMSDEGLDREALLNEFAARYETSAEKIEGALFGDLREEQRMIRFDRIGPEALFREYELAGAQAVLLRAESIEVRAESSSQEAFRRLFRKLKFHRLLYRVERAPRGYRIFIDGPLSLFQSSTRYGLRLALILPALRELDRFELIARVRWGAERERLIFTLEEERIPGAHEIEGPQLPEEVDELFQAMQKRGGRFEVSLADEIFEIPGLGVLLPDLCFNDRETGEIVYFEALGYWSREAVFKRIDFVEAGFDQKILFAVPERLRVSEELLPDSLPAALMSYKGKLIPRRVEAALEALLSFSEN